MATSLLGFNWQEENVQPEIKNASGFITSESHVLGFAPPRLSQIVAGINPTLSAFDIPVVLGGVVENYSVANGQQVIKIYEIGSVRSYLLAARADGQISLNRVLLNNQSLMRMMYAAYKDSRGRFNALIGNSSPGVQTIDVGNSLPGTVNTNGNGTNDFFFDMQNPIFRAPFGTMIFMKSADNKPYSAMFFEDCLISSHGFASSSSGVVIQEAASMRFGRAVPVNVRALAVAA